MMDMAGDHSGSDYIPETVKHGGPGGNHGLAQPTTNQSPAENCSRRHDDLKAPEPLVSERHALITRESNRPQLMDMADDQSAGPDGLDCINRPIATGKSPLHVGQERNSAKSACRLG